MTFNILVLNEFSFLKDIGVYNINCASWLSAYDWIKSQGHGDEKKFNTETDHMVEVSWGYYGDELIGLTDYAQNRFGPNVYECVAQCLEGFIDCHERTDPSNIGNSIFNTSTYEVLNALGIGIEKYHEAVKKIRELNNV